MFTAKEPPASSHTLVSWAEPIIARGSSFLLKFLAKSVFPAKEAPASSHMLVSRAEPKIGKAFEIEGTSGFLQNSVFTAKEPPASSHTLVSWAEPIIARGSSFLLKFLAKQRVSCKGSSCQ